MCNRNLNLCLSTDILSTSAAEGVVPLFLEATTLWQEYHRAVPGGQ